MRRARGGFGIGFGSGLAGHARSSTGAGRVGFIFGRGAPRSRAPRGRDRARLRVGDAPPDTNRGCDLWKCTPRTGPSCSSKRSMRVPITVVPQLDHTAVQRREDPWPLGVKGQALHAVRLGLRTHSGEYRMGQSKRSTGGTRAESGAITRGGHSRARREGEVTQSAVRSIQQRGTHLELGEHGGVRATTRGRPASPNTRV